VKITFECCEYISKERKGPYQTVERIHEY